MMRRPMIDDSPFPYDVTYPTPRYVNVYAVSRVCYSPAEGGCYCDVGEVVVSLPVRGERQTALALNYVEEQWGGMDTKDRNGGIGRYSVLGGADYRIVVEDDPAEAFPQEWPTYE